MKEKVKFLKNDRVIVGMTFIFFAFMMLFHLTHSALWGDEWVEYNYSQLSILNGELYNRVIATYQPPLYNFLMHFWLKMGTTLLWFRLFNVVLGCISCLFLFITLNTLLSKRIAVLVIGILATCYQWVYCIQECSEYALMLCFLFGALMFYTLCSEKFSYLKMGGFIICCVLAIYSQYGAVFVALPLLAAFFGGNICNRRTSVKKKIIIVVTYLFSLVVFAGPLYFKFLKLQMENNEISNNKVEFSAELLKDMPFTFGKIIAYLFNVNSGEIWPIIFGIAGLGLMVIFIVVLRQGKIHWTRLSLIISLWIGYIAHYLLVQLHIYAMAHPNQSAGFFVRYSYFYIPILCVTIPILIDEYIKVREKSVMVINYAVIMLCSIVIMISMLSILKNWNKALDDQFAKIWIDNDGWKDTTYLYGTASYGFNYYITHSDVYEEGYLDKVTEEVDNENLPPRFWAWRTNWGGDGWQMTIDKATELGYTVIVYNDSGYIGQLAYCYSE